jgi:hypothetical protein
MNAQDCLGRHGRENLEGGERLDFGKPSIGW